MKYLPRFTFGMGDRFGRQGEAQLRAIQAISGHGTEIFPVWNKSHREHTIVGSRPDSLRTEADQAVRNLGWHGDYFVDADHINLGTVDDFAACSDFFTIDVADFVGSVAAQPTLTDFLDRHRHLVGSHHLTSPDDPLHLTEDDLHGTATKFLAAVQEAGRIYRRIAELRPDGDYAIEVSMDETDTAQTPSQLLIILAMLADAGVPAQTLAPKFSGRFNKGVDYVGDLTNFEREFRADLAVMAYAVEAFGLPKTLKISVHSGSDKFSLYPIIRRALADSGSGLHLKTAGTTWLEEVAGLAEAGGDGLELAKEIYLKALTLADELIAPYAPVVDIDVASLPSPENVARWDPACFVRAMEHNPHSPDYQPQFRQFLHVSFKIAAKRGPRYLNALEAQKEIIGRRVTHNLLHRHLLPLFGNE